MDVSTIVGFNEKQVFNLYQNQNAYGYINSQHVGTVEQTTMVETLKELMQLIKTINQELEKRK